MHAVLRGTVKCVHRLCFEDIPGRRAVYEVRTVFVHEVQRTQDLCRHAQRLQLGRCSLGA